MLERYSFILAIIIGVPWLYISLRWPFLMAKLVKKHASFWRDFGKVNFLNLVVIPIVLYFTLAFALVKDNVIVCQGLSFEMYDAIWEVCYIPLYTLATVMSPVILFPSGLLGIFRSFFVSYQEKFFPMPFVVICFAIFFAIHLISSGIYTAIRTQVCHNPLNKKSILVYFLYLIYWVLGSLCTLYVINHMNTHY